METLKVSKYDDYKVKEYKRTVKTWFWICNIVSGFSIFMIVVLLCSIPEVGVSLAYLLVALFIIFWVLLSFAAYKLTEKFAVEKINAYHCGEIKHLNRWTW